MNGLFDSENPNETIHKGEYTPEFDNLSAIANAENTHKVVFNFWADSLKEERERIKGLCITDTLTKIKYVCNVAPYYYFQLSDPDGNVIEITGDYTPELGEFE